MTEINSKNLHAVISKIDDENYRNLFKMMFQKLTEKDQEIIQLTNRVEDLEKRVLEQERYSSKDSLIFYNVPIDKNLGLEEGMCQFLFDYLNISAYPEDFKACHPLGKPKGIYPAPIIIKFVYFKMKNEVYFRRTLLADSINYFNRKPIFIKERLPKFDRDIQNEASNLNLVTTTRNSEVRVFVKKPNNQVQSIGIKSSQMLKDLAPRAVQRVKQHANRPKRTFSIGSDVEDTVTAITKKSNDQNTTDADGKTVA